MSLDIGFLVRKPIVCPKCGEVVHKVDVDAATSGGRGWYAILEDLGYYVPFEQRTEENDWYGKDMALTEQQVRQVYKKIRQAHGLYNVDAILALLAAALCDGNEVVVNADW